MAQKIFNLPAAYLAPTNILADAFLYDLQNQEKIIGIEDYFKKNFGGRIINYPGGMLDIPRTLDAFRNKYAAEVLDYAKAKLRHYRAEIKLNAIENAHRAAQEKSQETLSWGEDFRQALAEERAAFQEFGMISAELSSKINNFFKNIVRGKETVGWLTSLQISNWAAAYSYENPVTEENLVVRVDDYLELLGKLALVSHDATLDLWDDLDPRPTPDSALQAELFKAAEPITKELKKWLQSEKNRK